MNIGILTHCIANNFGANLQALSTAYYLKNNGYTPIFFYWDSYLKKRSVKMHKEQLDMHRNFLKDNGFIVTRPCVTDDDFIDVIKHYEIKNIIIGSDAVFTLSTWVDRLKISRHGISFAEVTEDKLFPNPFWVPFINRVSNCKFFYMSPSCQSSNDIFFSKKLKKDLKLQLEQSSYLSARDSATQKMLQKILERNVDVPLTPDPVWGFSYNVNNIPPKEYIIKKYNIKNDYMLVSYYNSNAISFEWHDEFRRIANKKGIEVYSLPMPQGHFVSNLPKINLPINSLDWFALIKYSKGYVGHNMHPVIVSLHNIVPFFSFDQHGKWFWKFHFEKTSKVYDLLNRIDMMNYRVAFSKRRKITPQDVFDRLRAFDFDKCKNITNNMQTAYLKMMSEITGSFIND